MNDLGSVLLSNAVATTALALVVAGGARLFRRPALVHLLWLVVLVRLFMPPLLAVAVLPASTLPAIAATPSGTAVPAPTVSPAAPLEIIADLEPRGPTPPRPGSAAVWGAAIWIAGAVIVLALAVLRARRFDATLAGARDATPEFGGRASRLAAAMGLDTVPDLRLVRARIPPMLWHRPGRLSLLFPEPLLAHLDAGERDALLSHELAHVRRRDHWVRYLELFATVIFWWHPVVWWARRALRRAEEQCCDAWVVRMLAEHPRVYARALLKTLEFLAGGRVPTPALACAAGATGALKERLTMIMKRRVPRAPSRIQIAAAAIVATGALLLFPTWAEREEVAEPGNAERELRKGMITLERQAADLEEQLLDVRTRQRELERSFAERQGREELERVRAEADRAKAAGREEEARAAADEARRLDQRIAVEKRFRDLEREQARQRREIEVPLRRAQLELAEAELAGENGRAAEIRRSAEELEATLAERAAEMRRAQMVVESKMRQLAQETEAACDRDEASGLAEVEAEMRDQIRELQEQLREVQEQLGAR